MPFTPSIKQNVFEFKVNGSKKIWKLPLRQYLPVNLAERMTKNGLKLAKFKDELEHIQQATLAGENVDLPEGFDTDLIVELKDAQAALFDRFCPGLYDVANEDELNQIMNEWARVSNISMGE